MKSTEIRKKFIDFFEQNDHKRYDPSSLIPKEQDKSVLFTSAGMQQFKDWYIDSEKIETTRVVTIQPCLRTSDIDEVGDKIHHTFFEMMGNFSFGYSKKQGSYFKEQAIEMALEFLTDKKWLNIPKNKISATIFKGDKEVSKDQESLKILKDLGISEIKELGREDNFWGPVGKTGSCGPTVELFVPGKEEEIEVWNLVFNEYNKTEQGKLKKLEFQGVDTGMGFERLVAYLQDTDDDYKTDLFKPIINIISKKVDIKKRSREVRIMSDHIRAAVFMVRDGVEPSNIGRGYILRRILRKILAWQHILNVRESSKISISDLINLAKQAMKGCQDVYSFENPEKITKIIYSEFHLYSKTINKGIRKYEKDKEKYPKEIPGRVVFGYHDTYGLPVEIIKELFKEDKRIFNKEAYGKFEKQHQQVSRKGLDKKFKGGLADDKEMTIKLHTAAHLLHESLRKVLGKDVNQAGQNITEERLRFDFTQPKALSKEEIKQVEDLVNQQIDKGLAVTSQEMTIDEAISKGAVALFKDKYPENVTLYTIKGFSNELCLGPHVKNTSELGEFKITKEESSSKGVRRIKAVLQ